MNSVKDKDDKIMVKWTKLRGGIECLLQREFSLRKWIWAFEWSRYRKKLELVRKRKIRVLVHQIRVLVHWLEFVKRENCVSRVICDWRLEIALGTTNMRPTATWLLSIITARGERRMVTRHTSQTRIQNHQLDCAQVFCWPQFCLKP